MKLPENYKVLVITLSDRAYRGIYQDKSGPRVKELTMEFFTKTGSGCSVENLLIPDDAGLLKEKMAEAVNKYDLIFTTGGTGIGSRDVTPDVVRQLLSKEIPGIMEYIRMKYGSVKPSALLSRSIAGVSGKCLVYTLPGSVRAVEEYLSEIFRTLEHTYLMLYGIDRHE